MPVLDHRPTKLVGCWLLWEETRKSLQLDNMPSDSSLLAHYSRFAKEHELPGHKALRKTTTQLIQDHVGETEARLFRCEGNSDTHNSNYIKHYTPAQVAKLDDAIRKVGELYGVK